MSELFDDNESCETITLPCLCCGKEWEYLVDSSEARGIFNVFCPGGECEDKYAARL